MELVFRVIHHPVEHIGAAVVESGRFDRDATRSVVGGAESEGAVLFGAEADVALLRRILIIEVGEGGQAQERFHEAVSRHAELGRHATSTPG